MVETYDYIRTRILGFEAVRGLTGKLTYKTKVPPFAVPSAKSFFPKAGNQWMSGNCQTESLVAASACFSSF